MGGPKAVVLRCRVTMESRVADVFTLSLSKPTTPEALRAFRADVTRALDEGVRSLLVDIDEIGTLDSPAIAALIVALRAARERSAAISLRVSRPNLLDTLRVTALDQVFAIVVPLPTRPEAAVPKRRRRTAPRRTVAAVAAVMVAAGLSFGTAAADSTPAPDEIVQHLIAQNVRVATYEATIGVDVHMRSFPYLADHLDGTAYFKRPDHFELVFRKVPALAKGFDKLTSDIDDPTSWERRFTISYVGERTVGAHRDVVLRLVQRVRGMIDHEDVAVDPDAWHVDEMEWYYYNGGTIAMTQDYQNVGAFSVLASQHATIRIPYVHAAADATYTDYKTNVAIDDSVFTAKR